MRGAEQLPDRFLTLSKYYPYMAGASASSTLTNRAIHELTGELPYQLTYASEVYAQAYTPSSINLGYIPRGDAVADVRRVGFPDSTNRRVMDGTLNTALTGTAINLVQEGGVNAILTFYLEPHARIANEAAAYAEIFLGRKVITAHKAVGTDILESIAGHPDDGQGRTILQQFLKGDLPYAVSQYAKDELVRQGKIQLPAVGAESLEERTSVLYAPIDNEYFGSIDRDKINTLRRKLVIPEQGRIISYFGRVFPEKGINYLIDAFDEVHSAHEDAFLVIGGQGIHFATLQALARKKRSSKNIRFTGPIIEDEKRALLQTSEAGVIPTIEIPGVFVDTLCIAAIEYLASGTPLITTSVGGVPEAAGPNSIYAEQKSPRSLAMAMNALLSGSINRQEMITRGLAHAERFNYKKVTRTYLTDVARVAAQYH